ncbi:MAG: hypothetical protein EHM61_26555 [Acidobacteria bacterium]|nr:MAG: hypothetical protein EHM61_26555 [Acidobacteriota bacterium]
MRPEQSLVVTVLFLTLFTTIFSQEAIASQPPEIIYGQSSVEWPAPAPDANLVLTLSGPEGLYLKQEYQAGVWPRLSLIDEQGRARPEGVYKWELIVQFGWGSETQSGQFLIERGRAIPQAAREKQSATIEPGAPENSLYVDNQGRVGIGTSVPRAQLHLKGTAPGLAVEDTGAGGREYSLHSEEKGGLGLFDETAGKARWLVDAEGRLGINMTEPTSTLTVDGYIETTKGFLVNGRPLPTVGGFVGTRPLSAETATNNFFGTWAGDSNTTGTCNSFFGGSAGTSNTTGSYNSFFGNGTGVFNSTGASNAFFGASAGYSNTTGNSNSFFGTSSGYYNTEAVGNSFFGHSAGYRNTGNENSFFGRSSGQANTTGVFNSFFGSFSGYSNTIGFNNSFLGTSAGHWNTEGHGNSFFGANAGRANITGDGNSFFGDSAGTASTGGYNTAIGYYAGGHVTAQVYNTFLGAYTDLDTSANPQVTNATAVGYKSYVSRSNSVVLGAVRGYSGASVETFVGIGTPSPDRQLVVEGSQAIGKFRRLNESGPAFAPAFLLERGRGTNTAPLDITSGDYLGKVQFRGLVGGTTREYGAFAFISSDTNQNGRFSFVDRDLVTERMVVLNTGNVGIGTNAPTERLDVNGNLRVRGSVVYGAPAVPVPDYVFEPGFRLMPLPELEQYVTRERHLPDIPNASEIQAHGVNLGELQMKMLEKIEELTLRTIEQAKEIEALRQLVRKALGERDQN